MPVHTLDLMVSLVLPAPLPLVPAPALIPILHPSSKRNYLDAVVVTYEPP